MRLAMLVVVAIAACGGGSAKKPDAAVDAKAIDAVNVVNALGQLCPFAAGGGGTMCPAGNVCVMVTGVGTNTTTGYCSPDCNGMTTICTTGYTGPAGGSPQCALTPQGMTTAHGCAIVCTTMAQCGTGLSCVTVPNQNPPVKICVPT
jgi:hypothetical protein